MPLPSTLSCFKLTSHCWSRAGKGHKCQLILSDKRVSYMSPGQSNDCWHPRPTHVILCIILNPEFTSTTQRRKLPELTRGGLELRGRQRTQMGEGTSPHKRALLRTTSSNSLQLETKVEISQSLHTCLHLPEIWRLGHRMLASPC